MRFHVLLLLAVALSVSLAQAHSMNQAAVMLDFVGNNVEVEMQLPSERLGAALGRVIDSRSLDANRTSIAGYILDHFGARTPSGQDFSTRLRVPFTFETIDGAPYAIVHLELSPSGGTIADRLDLEDTVLLDRIPSQVTLVSIRSDWRTSVFANDPELIGIFRNGSRTLSVDRTGQNWSHGFRSIFHLGLRHIAEGTDHLLFLLALLLPAPLLIRGSRWSGHAGVRRSLLRTLQVVTAFTVGHSITLAIAAVGLVHVPGRPIEVLIAVSILVSAMHALRPLFPGREAVIACSFGLIHGLAFATTLGELGLQRWERVAAILAFNLGIETMQLVVVAATMPSLILLSRTRSYSLFRIAGAVFAGVASSCWIAERLWSKHTPVDLVVNGIAAHAVSAGAALFLMSLAFWWFRAAPGEHLPTPREADC